MQALQITKKQANEIYKAISSKLSSLDHKITVTGQDKKNATVKVSKPIHQLSGHF